MTRSAPRLQSSRTSSMPMVESAPVINATFPSMRHLPGKWFRNHNIEIKAMLRQSTPYFYFSVTMENFSIIRSIWFMVRQNMQLVEWFWPVADFGIYFNLFIFVNKTRLKLYLSFFYKVIWKKSLDCFSNLGISVSFFAYLINRLDITSLFKTNHYKVLC